MKRRDFVKGTALSAIGASLIAPLESFAGQPVTHLESEDLSPSAKFADNDYSIHFMALGDWGRNGEHKQLETAKQMGLWAAAHPMSFILSTGDNFYPRGIESVEDPLWHYSFENVYTAHSLQTDWYAVLGNHDHGASPEAQVAYNKISRRWRMPARYYANEAPLKGKDKGTVLFVMLDTNPMLHEEQKDFTTKQMEWLDETFRKASANVRWKIVVGHHPFYTVGPRVNNYDTLAMRKSLADVFEKNKVDIYLSGHEHSLQHIKPAGYTHQFISGAGSELTPVTTGLPGARFQASENGFMYFSIGANSINVKAVDLDGKILYDTELKK